jgi:LEA14-like dessication related protein
MPRDFEPPKVLIVNIMPKGMTLMEQRFEVQLRIQNANNVELRITGARFDIELNGKEFGSGMSGQTIRIPRFGSEVMTGEVVTSLGSVLKQVQGFSSGGTKVQYRLTGKAFADAPGSFTIPFEDTGEVDLNMALSGDK